MITLTQMAQKLQAEIGALFETAAEGRTDIFPENGKYSAYELTVTADTSDFKPAKREGNKATWYIQGLLTQIGSTIEGIQNGSRTAGVDCRLDFVVRCMPGVDMDGGKVMVPFFRSVLDDYFSTNQQGIMYEGTDAGEEPEGTTSTAWVFGTNYQMAQSGVREMIPGLGDTFSFTVILNWYFAEGGLNSQGIELTIDGNRIYFTHIGISRNTSDEKALPAGTPAFNTVSMVESNSLAIGFDAPAFTAVVDAVKWYLMDARQSVRSVELKIGEMSRTYLMQMSNATVNGDTILTASVSATLVETKPVTNGVTTLESKGTEIVT